MFSLYEDTNLCAIDIQLARRIRNERGKFRKRVGGGRGSSGLVREGEWTRFWMGRELSSERGEAGPRVDVS